jgi:hypothetical protein
VPLLLLSALGGRAVGEAVRIPFLYDFEAHARFLVALPLLIFAEVFIHNRIGPLIRKFAEKRIVRDEDVPRYNAAVSSALRLRNSVAVEATLLVLVYTLGLWVWRNEVAAKAATWYASPDATGLHLTFAGYWNLFVSTPIFQFILLRWYLRMALWFLILWRISRLDLHLTAAHPDHAGGIGFLGSSSYAYTPIVLAQGALLSGFIADRIIHDGKSLLNFQVEAAGFVGFFVLFILGPLFMFTPQLERARRKGSGEYSSLARRYDFEFEEKWMQGRFPEGKLLGSPDIQALADITDISSSASEMRLVPFGPRDIVQLAAAAAIPLLPLMLTMFSAQELLTRMIKIVF